MQGAGFPLRHVCVAMLRSDIKELYETALSSKHEAAPHAPLQTYFSDTLKIRVPSADAPMYELIREAHASVTLRGASISNSEQYFAAMKQEVARRLRESPVFWARLWPAGLALGKLLLMQPALVRGKTVLELGCGLGPGALCAAVAGAREVVATDIEPKALEFVKQSAADNGMSQVCCACVLDWNGRVPATLGGPFDVVLAGDVIYQDEHAPALGRLLASSALVKPDGLVIFSDSLERPYGTSHQSELCERLGASGFEQVESRDLDVSADCPARTGVAAGRYVRLLIYTKPGPRSRVARTVPIDPRIGFAHSAQRRRPTLPASAPLRPGALPPLGRK